MAVGGSMSFFFGGGPRKYLQIISSVTSRTSSPPPALRIIHACNAVCQRVHHLDHMRQRVQARGKAQDRGGDPACICPLEESWDHCLAITMSFATILRASSRISITSRAEVLTGIHSLPQRAFVGWRHPDRPYQGATRTITTAPTTVPSDQLGFVPDKHPTTDLPIASADDRKIAILWSPQNWSRLYVSKWLL